MAAPKKTSKSGVYRAKEAFSGQRGPKGKEVIVVVGRGELCRAESDAVKLFPEFFEPVEDYMVPEVEQATAAPGEKR